LEKVIESITTVEGLALHGGDRLKKTSE